MVLKMVLGDRLLNVFSVYAPHSGHMVVLGTALGTLMVPGYWSLQMG